VANELFTISQSFAKTPLLPKGCPSGGSVIKPCQKTPELPRCESKNPIGSVEEPDGSSYLSGLMTLKILASHSLGI
jgi:hypothetical protein